LALVTGEREEEPHASLWAWQRRLIELRRRIPALSDGRLDRVHVSFDETTKWFVVKPRAVVIARNLVENLSMRA